MRNLVKNKRKMHYALLGNDIPIYERDGDGNIRYVIVDGVSVPVTTGQTQPGYSLPVEFKGNISETGEISIAEFGVDIGDYDAIVICDSSLPIKETSLIWYQSEVTYLDALETSLNPQSADYSVKAIKPSLNQLKLVLKRMVK